jgi:hypothetical protein
MSLRHVHHYVTLLQKKKNDKNKNQKSQKIRNEKKYKIRKDKTRTKSKKRKIMRFKARILNDPLSLLIGMINTVEKISQTCAM